MTPDNPYGPFDAGGGNTIKCPYCAEPDFDAAGLKSHLLSGDCEEWNETENLTRVFSSTPETRPALCADCQQPGELIEFNGKLIHEVCPQMETPAEHGECPTCRAGTGVAGERIHLSLCPASNR